MFFYLELVSIIISCILIDDNRFISPIHGPRFNVSGGTITKCTCSGIITYANKEESVNDPLAKKYSNFTINWETCPLSQISQLSKSHIYEKILRRKPKKTYR